jgi:flavodoxin
MMQTLIVNYSKTGNNAVLADFLGQELNADRAEIQPIKQQTMFRIILDMVFSRQPKLQALDKAPEDYDQVVLVGPVWMGKLASPLYSYIKGAIGRIPKLSFIGLVGGALGHNDEIPAQLQKLGEGKTKAVSQLYINDLLTEEQKGKMKETSDFKIDPKTLSEAFGGQIREFLQALRN